MNSIFVLSVMDGIKIFILYKDVSLEGLWLGVFWRKKLVIIVRWSLLELKVYYFVFIRKCMVLKWV